MASLKDLYDSEVIDSIVRNYSADVSVDGPPTEPKVDPLTDIAAPRYTADEGEFTFSSVFGEPTTIPNIPIPMFAIENWD